MQESFEQYVNRVSRAGHILAIAMRKYDYFLGVSEGYHNSSSFMQEGQKKDVMLELSDYARRLSIKGKTAALIAQDRVLTYREEDL